MNGQTLSISTGTLAVPVERDGVRVGTLTLTPDDPVFLNKFYALLPALEQRRAALAALPQDAPHAGEALAALDRVTRETRDDIDAAFGAGTSMLVFGDACTPAMLEQFFTGIADALRPAREEKLAAYLTPEDALA